MAFITDERVFCYKLMSLGLKNAGATYQRMMNKVFKDQINRDLEVDVYDMLIKSKTLEEHLADLEENFSVMKANKVRINLAECIFRVAVGKFLGFMLIKRGIKVNPSKCKVILEMRSLNTLKEVQRLNGCITALSRFMSRLAEKCLPFYSIQKKDKTFT